MYVKVPPSFGQTGVLYKCWDKENWSIMCFFFVRPKKNSFFLLSSFTYDIRGKNFFLFLPNIRKKICKILTLTLFFFMSPKRTKIRVKQKKVSLIEVKNGQSNPFLSLLDVIIIFHIYIKKCRIFFHILEKSCSDANYIQGI